MFESGMAPSECLPGIKLEAECSMGAPIAGRVGGSAKAVLLGQVGQLGPD